MPVFPPRTSVAPSPAPREARALFYRPSGRLHLPRLGLATALALLAALALGLAYGALHFLNPLVFFGFLLPACGGLGLGLLAGAAIQFGRVRSTPGAVPVALLLGLSAWWASWLSWLALLLPFDAPLQSVLALGRSPSLLLETVAVVYESGTWGVGRSGEPVSGLLLGGLWLVEALVLLGLPLSAAVVAARTPYCEACGRWADQRQGALVVGGTTDRLVALLGDPTRDAAEVLAEAGPPPAPEAGVHHHRVDATWCPTCDDLRAISVVEVIFAAGRNGLEAKPSAAAAVRHRLLSPTEVDGLERGARGDPAPAGVEAV